MIPLPSYLIAEPSKETASLSSNCARMLAAVQNRVSSASVCPGHTLAIEDLDLRVSNGLEQKANIPSPVAECKETGIGIDRIFARSEVTLWVYFVRVGIHGGVVQDSPTPVNRSSHQMVIRMASRRTMYSPEPLHLVGCDSLCSGLPLSLCAAILHSTRMTSASSTMSQSGQTHREGRLD